MDRGDGTAPSSLTPAEAAERKVRLQAKHEQYLQYIDNGKVLPRLKSSIAGAGGTTNQEFRIAQEIEEARQAKMQKSAQEKLAQKKLEREQATLEAQRKKIQDKRKAKRQRLEANQAKRAEDGSDGESEKEEPRRDTSLERLP